MGQFFFNTFICLIKSSFCCCEDDYSGLYSVNYGALSLGTNGEKVKMVKLDDYIKHNNIKNIKIIKVDTEGAHLFIDTYDYKSL